MKINHLYPKGPFVCREKSEYSALFLFYDNNAVFDIDPLIALLLPPDRIHCSSIGKLGKCVFAVKAARLPGERQLSS